MFEQRFDHICWAHEEAMDAMRERMRTVLAARGAGGGAAVRRGGVGGVDGIEGAGGADRAAAPLDPVRDPQEARRAASGPPAQEAAAAPVAAGPEHALPEHAVPEHAASDRGGPEAAARWPERFDLPSGAPMFDPRWNCDLL